MQVPNELFERVLEVLSAAPTEASHVDHSAVREDLRKLRLPVGVFQEVGGKKTLCCPHGHSGPFRHLEDTSLWRSIDPPTADDDPELVVVNSYYQAYDEDTSNERLLCLADDAAKGEYGECPQEFALPEGVEFDFI